MPEGSSRRKTVQSQEWNDPVRDIANILRTGELVSHDPPTPEKGTSSRDRYFLTTPSFFMRASNVVGFSPSASAAPPEPRTRQPVRSRIRKM